MCLLWVHNKACRLRHITEDELERFWIYEMEAYAGANVIQGDGGNLSIKAVRAWWETYPRGLVVLVDDCNVICGAFGLWPLKCESFQQLLLGAISEYELGPADLHPNDDHPGCSTWYWSGISLRPDLRGTGISVGFASAALTSWSNTVNLLYPIQICAVAATRAGLHLLKRMSFEAPPHRPMTPEGWSVYRRIITSPSELLNVTPGTQP
jgi:hypothetical protein